MLHHFLGAQRRGHWQSPNLAAVLHDGPYPPAFALRIAQCGSASVVTGYLLVPKAEQARLPSAHGKACRRGFFLPVRVLSRYFRRVFLERLKRAYRAAKLQFIGRLPPLSARREIRQNNGFHAYTHRVMSAAVSECTWVNFQRR